MQNTKGKWHPTDGTRLNQNGEPVKIWIKIDDQRTLAYRMLILRSWEGTTNGVWGLIKARELQKKKAQDSHLTGQQKRGI